MKKLSVLMVLLGFLFEIPCMAQFWSILQPECGILQNTSYHFENYQWGSQGAGYTLYHNGIAILDEHENYGGYAALELKFSDSISGYFVSEELTGHALIIRRVFDDDTDPIGSGMSEGGYFIYIVNQQNMYLVNYFFSTLCVTRFTDNHIQEQLAWWHPLVSDTTVFDTINGEPFCSDLTQIDILSVTGSDTVTFTIMLHYLNVGTGDQEVATDVSVYPNPVSDRVHIQVMGNCRPFSATVLDNLGRQTLKKVFDDCSITDLFIGDHRPGIYTIIVDFSDSKRVFKLIKI